MWTKIKQIQDELYQNKKVMHEVMLYLCSLIITLQFHEEKKFQCALYCEIVKIDHIDLSGTPCIEN